MFDLAFYSLTELPVRFLGFNLSLLRHPLELIYDNNIFGVIKANSSMPSFRRKKHDEVHVFLHKQNK